MGFLFVLHLCDTGSGAGGKASGKQNRDGVTSRKDRGVVVFGGEGHVVLGGFEGGGDVAGEDHDAVAEVIFEGLLNVRKFIGFGKVEIEVHR